MLAFLLIVGVSYYLVATSLIGLVGDSLFSDRMRQDHAAADKLAAELGPLYAERDMEKAQQLLESAGGELGGRLMLLDQSGKVQLDTFCELNGSRLELPEVVSVLSMGSASDYGVHRLDDNGGENSWLQWLRPYDPNAEWVAYCTSALTADGVVQGVLLYSSPVQEMMDRLSSLQTRMVAYFLIAAAAAMVIALIFSRVLTRPIVSLTKSIQRMGHGDLSVRVPVKGSGELRRLSETFNTMSEKLQMLDTSRNQFVSNASHELKTPLAGIRLLTDSILQTGDMDADTTREFVGDIGREAERLTRITENLLRLTRLDSGAVPPVTPVPVAPVLERVARMLAVLAREKNVTLSYEAEPQAVALATEDDVHQILYNLMDNGIKYSGTDGFVHAAAATDGDWVVLTVEDNGIGIPEDDLPHIFERFYRVDKMRSRAIGGTGLGLSIVKDTVENRGGSITAAARQGGGTVFTVRLPRAAKEGGDGQ